MSTWTHVNAHFRFNSFVVDRCDYNNVREIEKFIGPEFTFKDVLLGEKKFNRYHDKKSTLPRGSEGSLGYHVYLTGHESHERVNIAFYGDLRDFDNAQAIIDYFESFLNAEGAHIYLRSGVVEINTIAGTHSYLVEDIAEEGHDYRLVKNGELTYE